MKIGVWVTESVSKNSGGSFTYYNTLIAGIDSLNFNPVVDIVFITRHDLLNCNKPFINIKNRQKGISFFTKILRKALKLVSKNVFNGVINFIDQKEKKIQDRSAAAYLQENGVKIIFYPLPASDIIEGIPYILNNWDLAHYVTYAFPEIFGNDGFKKRNDWYSIIMPEALLVFCETEAGKKEISKYIKFNPDKIRVLPMFASNMFINRQLSDEEQTNILETFGLQPQNFFFYPAQFWAHKNHYTLVKAFQKFHKEYPGHKLFFCGSDKGNVSYIKNCVKALDLEDCIIFGGFVEDNALYTFYKNARALVFPTFFGPSNIPPIEAMRLNCPVLCSDIDGHKEIMNDAALYFDPLDELSILEGMKEIMNDSTRMQIQQNQMRQSELTHHTIEKALIKLDAYLMEAINIRSCWE
jgi:glycosyltransferase involved in cell wall biosynthesis